jgi:putative DNA primase/helicase
LWTAFSHVHDAFRVSPILTITSPTMRSGKTTLLNILGRLVAEPLLTSNMSPASLYRALDEKVWTLIADEADTWFNKDEQMRGIWNSGHTRDFAWVLRVDGGGNVRQIPTWGPKTLSLIRRDPRDLPPTIQDRSVVIAMRRARMDEPIEPLRIDRIGDELRPLRQKVARWAYDHIDALRGAEPEVPGELNHRARDNWRSLLSVADLVGGPWPQMACLAAKVISGPGDETDEKGLQALADLRDTFDAEKADRVPSALVALRRLPDGASPQAIQGEQNRLANLLRPFGIRTAGLWSASGADEKGALRGYWLRDCQDAFERYLLARGEGKGGLAQS